MVKGIGDKLKKNLGLDWIVHKSKRIILPGMEGLSLYDLWEIYSLGIIQGAFSMRANSIAFNFFMAIFPFLLFLLNLIPFIWFIEDFKLKFLVFVDNRLPPQTHDFFGDIFADIAGNQRVGLLSFVFILSVFLMANGINAVFEGFESSFHTQANRSFFRKYAVAIGVSIIVALLLLFTVMATVYLTVILGNLRDFGLLSDNVIWVEIGRYLVFVAMIYMVVATLYYFGTREGKLHKFFSVGAFFTMLLIILTTFLFGVYINNFSTYNELYGSIGALLILMAYIWLNSNILLLGFELNTSLAKLKQKR